MAKLRRPIVIVESPYAGDIAANVEYARACVRDSILRGEAPVASHLLYTQPGVLRDEVPEERQLGMLTGWAFLFAASKVAVYVDRGISTGMQHGMENADQLGVPVELRRLGKE